MKIIDGHSHMYQTYAPSQDLKKGVEQIDGFNIQALLARLDEIEVSRFQTMPQEMTRIRGLWLGSNALSADIQRSAPARVVSFAAAEPMDAQDVFNRARLVEVEEAVVKKGLRGLLLTPPYGHYYANDKRVYPFYEKAVALDIPIYFHHSHQFGPSRYCPMKYARPWLLDDLTIDFPDLRFNVEHMGYPWTEELLAIMTRSSNVYTDIAMFIDPLEQGARGSHLLSALSHRLGLTVWQLAVDDKTNEIPVALEVLQGLLLERRVVTVDALLTQRAVASTILAGGGDYVMWVKGNQPALEEDIRLVFEEGKWLTDTLSSGETLDSGHGRLERRCLTSSTALLGYSDWPGLQQVFRLERSVTYKKSGQRRQEIV